jgi:hypothetical protein
LAPTSGISVDPVATSVPLALPTDSGNMASSKVTAGMFPHLHLVTPTQRQTIIEGKYINLASLLVPPSDNHDIRQIEVECGIEDRRVELDNYLQDIIDMAAKFKGKRFMNTTKPLLRRQQLLSRLKV